MLTTVHAYPQSKYLICFLKTLKVELYSFTLQVHPTEYTILNQYPFKLKPIAPGSFKPMPHNLILARISHCENSEQPNTHPTPTMLQHNGLFVPSSFKLKYYFSRFLTATHLKTSLQLQPYLGTLSHDSMIFFQILTTT